MFVLYADKNRLSVRRTETLTSGSVNAYTARFEFSPDWDGLTRTAVFQAGAESRSILLDESGTCGIPWEVLTAPDVQLRAGVYGTLGGEVVLPTVWARLGTVFEGVSPGPDAAPPTPDRWQQELDKKGDKLAYTDSGDLGLYSGGKLLSAVPIEGGGGSGVVPDIQATATTLPPGSPATVTRSGPDTAPVFDFGIPEGQPGRNGDPGETGSPGKDGKSAYQIAVDGGFEGTEAEWLASLVGPQGPDGNPVGTIISFMGITAPDGYLVCDGAEYPIKDYPALANFLQQQFGAVNYFGGDGLATFAVPDMRNLFLRGYRGEAENRLSGDIGAIQEATEFTNVFVGLSSTTQGFGVIGNGVSGESVSPTKMDKITQAGSHYSMPQITTVNTVDKIPSVQPAALYTSRPINMAVLYCIKATEGTAGGGSGESAGVVYSTEETRIGTWIDGKPLYGRMFELTMPTSSGDTVLFHLSDDIYEVVGRRGRFIDKAPATCFVPMAFGTSAVDIYIKNRDLTIVITSPFHASGKPLELWLEYTKTTDPVLTETEGVQNA